MPKIDNLLLFRCVQVVRRLQLKNREVGLFCNISASTLTDAAQFRQFLDFIDANRALGAVADVRVHAGTPIAPSARSRTRAWRRWPSAASASPWTTSPTCAWSRATSPSARSASSRCRPSCCSTSAAGAQSDIHPADLADLLARSGIDLIAERIESESMVVDLLDYDVRFGQGFLFSPPRPVRAGGAAAAAPRPVPSSPTAGGRDVRRGSAIDAIG